ncbi:MAG: KEOPS complex subunit Pcc1 [Candidatus Woesearchaeota archaeon]
MFKATIVVSEGAGDLEKLFSFEDKVFQNERASYKTSLEGGVLTFFVEARDSVALRSVLNTISKLLSVYEKSGVVLGKNE